MKIIYEIIDDQPYFKARISDSTIFQKASTPHFEADTETKIVKALTRCPPRKLDVWRLAVYDMAFGDNVLEFTLRS